MRTAAFFNGIRHAVVTLGILSVGAGAATAQQGSGLGETLRVHGHWIIEIYEGARLIDRVEFENELVGAEVLGRALAREATIGPWEVHVAGEHEWEGSTVTCPPFLIFHDGTCFAKTFDASTVAVPDTGDNAGAIVLQDEFVKADITSVEGGGWRLLRVGTRIGVCDPAVPPAECAARSFDTTDETPQVTARTLDTGIDVQPGQRAVVTVIVSFQ